MSITAYTGLPGSGKSYTVVQSVIIPALKEGRQIFTNIPLIDDLLVEVFGYAPTVFDVADIDKNIDWFQDVLPAGALLVLDECWRVWPSGLKATNVKESHKSFLAEHRHMVGVDGRSTEIVLVTQDTAQLAAFVRQLIEKTFRTTKLDVLGMAKKYRLDIYEGAVTGSNPPVKKRVREIFGKYDPEIYRFYKSHTKSQTGAAGDESKADDRANIFKGAGFKGMIAFLVACVVLVIFGGRYVYGVMFGKKPTSEFIETPASGSPSQPAAPAHPRSPGFLDGKKVHIVFNNEADGSIDYRFRITDDEVSLTLGLNELHVLGYEVKPVSQCLAIVTRNSLLMYVQCRRAQENNAFASTVNTFTGNTTN